MRLNAYIAKSGYTSRRKADDLIRTGGVKINGEVVKDFSYQVKSRDRVSVRNKDILLKNHVYIIFNKPGGVTTTLEDRFADKKIMDFLPQCFKGVYPAGRLDKNSAGLILLTNDGDFCYTLTHPKFGVEKEYFIRLNRPLNLSDCCQAKNGVTDDGELLKVKEIKILKANSCKVIVNEGKKRHLRRLFKQLGFTVSQLKRIRIGNLRLGNLAPGKYRAADKDYVYNKVLGKFGLKRIRKVIV